MRDLALLKFPTAGDALPVVLWRAEEEPAIGDKWIKWLHLSIGVVGFSFLIIAWS